MKKYFKVFIAFVLVLTFAVALTGCVKEENNGGETTGGGITDGGTIGSSEIYSFPVADFIPSGVEYNAGGTIEHVTKGVTSADIYVRNATLEDALSYVALLKEKGLTYANPVKEEPTGMSEFGYFSWTGANSDDTFCVTVNFLDEEESFNALEGNKVLYNMSINLANENIYGE